MTDKAQLERVELRDGAAMLVRPIRADDKALLKAGFERLSPTSRYRRFLASMTTLRGSDLVYFTEIDHVDHEALIALDARNGELMGVARYVRFEDEPEVAEFAVAVVDDWQGRGVATELLRRLVPRARRAGITRCHATCLADNRQVIDLLEELGPAEERRVDELLELDIRLPLSIDRAGPLRRAVRRAAADELAVKHPPPRASRRREGEAAAGGR